MKRRYDDDQVGFWYGVYAAVIVAVFTIAVAVRLVVQNFS
jgi:hypothetical protein